VLIKGKKLPDQRAAFLKSDPHPVVDEGHHLTIF
jgi:hypothetical protein